MKFYFPPPQLVSNLIENDKSYLECKFINLVNPLLFIKSSQVRITRNIYQCLIELKLGSRDVIVKVEKGIRDHLIGPCFID